ncbi:MAG: family 20 glycosylhydrolase [Chitinophagaceae bacterium]
MKSRKYSFIFSLLLLNLSSVAQIQLPQYPDSLFSTYYHQRATQFNSLPKTNDDIIFIGNSITDGGEWSETFNDLKIKNRGISGDITAGVLNRLDEVAKRKPAKVFLLIGVNDLSRGISADSVVKNILLMASFMRQETPSTNLFIQSILPVNDIYNKFQGHTSKAKQVKEVNDALSKNAAAYRYTYIDLYLPFSNRVGKLKPELSNDGLHLKGEGYLLWKHLLYPFIYGLQSKPSLLPQPQQLKWNQEIFNLYQCKEIKITQDSLQIAAVGLQQFLAAKGQQLSIQKAVKNAGLIIELRIEKVDAPLYPQEAYKIDVNEKRVLISANSLHGIFNGIQTFKQLMRDGAMIDACEITDWPAFSWRGYMVDVGRNYQSIKQLKQQIDVMAAYKLNIFHFHLTEDIAWRLQSKQYPQLTEPKNMLRNPGEYYSLDEMRELIQYCKDRFITLIPEIDMPGHSAAFKRAMGVDMQSEEGVTICKNILTELFTELDVPYIHIGGDEVKITNKDFMPLMTAHVKSLGKIIMAWDPGGNVPEGTILQMWNGNTKPKPGYPAIDSRHLYLNHFDPFDGVTATFNHQIDDVSVGDEKKLGAILCNWPDRRVNKEEDLITMNAVYPVMLSFAERCWQGGGWKNYLSDFDLPGTERYKAFVEFENRLLDHKQHSFGNKPFPYFKQSDIEWKLIGPFVNKGKTASSFLPETKMFLDSVQLKNYPSIYGATIWLRHFWHPMISSHLKDPKENTTWYATRKIWSDEAGEKDFWIGFNNLSRSTATDSPPIGAWDALNSAVWVNGKLIEPHHWKRGGQKGDSEIPMADEGYEYRPATKIFLQKGWNTILIKAPVAGFKGADWQNPVKWMFTFIQL